MIRYLLYLILLSGISISLQSSQNFNSAIWSMPADRSHRSNELNNNHFNQSETSKMNSLKMLPMESELHAMINCDHKDHNKNFYNKKAKGKSVKSEEDFYVFLKKGRALYMPLNPKDKIIESHSPMNVNGKDVHLSDTQVLQNLGLSHQVLNSHKMQNPYHFQTQNDAVQKRISKNRKTNNNRHFQNQRNYQPNRYDALNQYNQKSHMLRNHKSSKKSCKKNNIKNRPVYANRQFNVIKPKQSKDCKPKRIKSEKSFTAAHQGVVKVNRARVANGKSPKCENDSNSIIRQAEADIINQTESSETAQTKSPQFDINKPTENTIHFKGMENSTKITQNLINQTRNDKTFENNKRSSSDINETESTTFYNENEISSKSKFKSVPRTENITENTEETTENSNEIFTTEIDQLSTTENLQRENSDESMDLEQSEDRLYAYVTKPKKKRKFKNVILKDVINSYRWQK